MRLPTFFIVGAPKAGTTSLARYLGQHPDVFMSPHKEPHFFTYQGDGWPTWATKTLEEYGALFAGAGSAKEVGEASTWYLYSPTAAERIQSLLPEARILILLRSPADRAYSSWSFNVQNSWEPILDFEEALEAEEKRRAEPGFWDRHYFHAGLYAEQVKRYLERFGRDRVLVHLFEDLRTAPDRVMRSSFEFLQVDPSFDPALGVQHNQTEFPRFKELNRFLRKSKHVRQVVRMLLPETIRRPLRQGLQRANRGKRPPLSETARTRLNAAYREDVERLSALLERDVTQIWF